MDNTVPEKAAEPEDPLEAARLNAVEAVNRLLEASELSRGDMVLTDVVVVAAQRGVYDTSTGSSLVVSLIPTDTPQYAVHGLLDMAKIEATQRAEHLYGRWNTEEDES